MNIDRSSSNIKSYSVEHCSGHNIILFCVSSNGFGVALHAVFASLVIASSSHNV